MGSKQWVRILLPILVVIIVTWYAKQDRNNPFSNIPCVQITGNQSGYYLSFGKQHKNSMPLSMVVLLKTLLDTTNESTPLLMEKIPLLVSLQASSDLPKFFHNPPKQWLIFSDLPNKKINEDIIHLWPQPVFTQQYAEKNRLLIQKTHPFTHSNEALHINFETITILLIDTLINPTSKEVQGLFKEKYDIVVLAFQLPSKESIVHIHDLFRPLYLLAEEPIHTTDTFLHNGILTFPPKKDFQHSFYRNSKGIVHLQE